MGFKECKVGDVIWRDLERFNKLERNKSTEDLNWLLREGIIGCTSPMSDKEFQYYSTKEQQRRQFQHAQSIQNQKSWDKSMDQINKSLDSMTPKNYNVNVYHY